MGASIPEAFAGGKLRETPDDGSSQGSASLRL